MTTTSADTEHALWQALHTCPQSDAYRLVLADYLQERGELALALRWAVAQGKWPLRACWERRPYPWIWHREGGWARLLPHYLPRPLFEAIRDRSRDDSNSPTLREAYVCLGRGLATLREILACP